MLYARQTSALLSHLRVNSAKKTVSVDRRMFDVLYTWEMALAPVQTSPCKKNNNQNLSSLFFLRTFTLKWQQGWHLINYALGKALFTWKRLNLLGELSRSVPWRDNLYLHAKLLTHLAAFHSHESYYTVSCRWLAETPNWKLWQDNIIWRWIWFFLSMILLLFVVFNVWAVILPAIDTFDQKVQKR